MNEGKPIAIIGVGGHGREALDIIRAINTISPTYQVLGFLDDSREIGSPATPHAEVVIGRVDDARHLDATIVVAVGSPQARRTIVDRLGNVHYANLVHPHASIGSFVNHGPGLIMAAGSRITHAVTLGSHVHLNVDSSINHDCRVGNFVTVTPGSRLSGAVTIGNGVWMGVNSSVIQGVSIGDDVVVGAGAAVISDLPDDCTAVGVPAKPKKTVQ